MVYTHLCSASGKKAAPQADVGRRTWGLTWEGTGDMMQDVGRQTPDVGGGGFHEALREREREGEVG